MKEHDFALGDPARQAAPAAGAGGYEEEHNQFVLAEPDGEGSAARRSSSRSAARSRTAVVFRLELEPRERWELRIDVVAVVDGDALAPRTAERRFGEELDARAGFARRVAAARAAAARRLGRAGQSFCQSVSDLASLRMRGAGRIGRMPAAGMPWFMTVFGRDTIITCLQTLLFGPELARTALEVLAELQAREDNPYDRRRAGQDRPRAAAGKAAKNWFRTYYGTVDATPLYLVLLSEVWRWTDDASFVR